MQLALQTMRGYTESVALARWAETSGVVAFSAADHYLVSPGRPEALDQLTVLAAVATATERIELATLVSPVTFRHPAVMLKTAVTIDEISGGRFALGVGTGWMEEEHERFGFDFPPVGERFDRLAEALAYLRAALDDNEEGFTGDYYRLAPGPSPQPRGSTVRLIVGGTGPKRTPTLAGTFADEYNLSASPVPVTERIERARRAAVEAGRDPDALRISMAFPIVVGADQAELDDRVEAVADRRGASVEEIRSRWDALGIPIGTTDEYLTRLASLHDLGIQRIYFQVAFDPLEDVSHSISLLT